MGCSEECMIFKIADRSCIFRQGLESLHQNTKWIFFISASVTLICYFSVKKFEKSLLRANKFFSEIGLQYMGITNQELMLISDLKELFRWNVPKKDSPKNCFQQQIFLSPLKKCFLSLTFFGAFFLSNFFSSVKFSFFLLLEFWHENTNSTLRGLKKNTNVFWIFFLGFQSHERFDFLKIKIMVPYCPVPRSPNLKDVTLCLKIKKNTFLVPNSSFWS
jgi:hypothetical protein